MAQMISRSSVSYDASLQPHLETPHPCFSSSAIYSALTLAKGTVENLQLFQRSNVQAEEAEPKSSSSTSLHPASSSAIVTATCSWYPKSLWHVVNGRTAFLFSFELQLKNVRLVHSRCKTALQCLQKEQEYCPQSQILSFISSRCYTHTLDCRCGNVGVEIIK